MVNISFPVHMAGEVSGIVSLKDENQIKTVGIGIKLIPVNEGKLL